MKHVIFLLQLLAKGSHQPPLRLHFQAHFDKSLVQVTLPPELHYHSGSKSFRFVREYEGGPATFEGALTSAVVWIQDRVKVKVKGFPA